MTRPDLFTHTTPADAFDGKTYEPERDYVRLRGQMLDVYRLMSDGKWRTLREIADVIHGSESGVSARLRDFRKSQYGGHTVQRERIRRGLHRYRLVIRDKFAPAPIVSPNAGSLREVGAGAE